jgi:hypothetical protein
MLSWGLCGAISPAVALMGGLLTIFVQRVVLVVVVVLRIRE